MKPLPKPTALTQPFWDGAKAGELRIQKCTSCGDYRFFPSEGCHGCGSPEYNWEKVDGKAQVYSWIVIHRPTDEAWYEDVPFAVIVGQLNLPGKPLVTGTYKGDDLDAISSDMMVRPVFEAVSEDISLLRWLREESS